MSDTATEPTPDQRARMASFLNLYPDPDYWDIELIDRMIFIERTKGREGLYEEFRRMFEGPQTKS